MEFKAMDFLVKLLISLLIVRVSQTQELINLALGRGTTQSGTFGSRLPSLAVDGDKNDLSYEYCAHPHTDNDPSFPSGSPAWWSVDLSPSTITPSYFYVRYVILYQRRDCCVDRTAPLDIKVGNTSDPNGHIKCGELLVEDVLGANVSCDYQYPVRFLSIHHRTKTSLGICEVEVMGSAEMICSPGYYGSNCERECHCLNSAPCDKQDGFCSGGCAEGFVDVDCSKELPIMTQPLNLLNKTHNMIYFSFEAATPSSPIAFYVVQKNGVDFTYPNSPGVVTFDNLYSNSLYTMRVIPVIYLSNGQPSRGNSSNLLEVLTEVEPTTVSSTSSTTSTTSPTSPTTSTTASTSSSTTETILIPTPSPTVPPESSSTTFTPSVSVPSSQEPMEEKKDNTTMIIIIVIVLLIVIAIIIIIACLLLRRKDEGDGKSRSYLTSIPLIIQRMKKKKGNADTSSIPSDHEHVVVVDQEDYEVPTPAASPSTLKRQIDNAAQDPSPTYTNATASMKRPGIKISELPKYIQAKKQKPDGFKDEYKILPNGPTASWIVGNKPENKAKNRFLNIRAYDHSRVVLPKQEDDIHSDYINADYISGYGGKEKAYIAAQGPKKSTINDMWRMVWECNTNRIVMVTNVVEGGKMKCERYWPDKDTETYGDMEVTILSQNSYSAYVIRTLNITRGEESRTVRIFHFTGWPDHGVPMVATDLLEFRRRIRAFDNGSTGPMLIHCSAGVGRTGTFIAVDYNLDQAEAEGEVNVWNVTNQMRSERVNMIQTLDQYIFVYDALYEAILSGDTLMDSVRFKEEYSSLSKQDSSSDSVLEHQFQVLETLKNTKQDEKLVGLQDDNIKKNRSKDLVPNNRFRPFLSTQVEGTTSYINAVYIDSFMRKHALVATQMPLPKTGVDFWRLIFDHQSNSIVMLNDYDSSDSNSPMYWPNSKEENLEFGPMMVSLDEENTEHEGLVIRKFTVQNVMTKRAPAIVKQFQVTCWPKDEARPQDVGVLLKTVDLIERWQQEHGVVSALTIHDQDGTSRCGLFIALVYVLEQLKVDQQVDVFRCVKQIRVPRHQFISDLDQYKFIHNMAIEYMDRFGDYSNFN